jgi:hypothetical protein
VRRLFLFGLAVAVLSCARPVAEDSASRSAGPSATVSITPATTRPTPTPEATIRKKVGTAVTFEDGWKITVTAFADQEVPRTGFTSSPSPGNRFVKLTVRYDNGTPKEASYNALDWKVQDSNGVRKSTVFAFVQLPDPLNSGKLAPGGFVSGSILFEVPVAEQRAMAIYESFSYKQATWELY